MNTKVGTTLSMLISCIYLTLSAAAPTRAQTYTIQDLGTLPQGSDCYAYNLNDAGQVVGSSGSNGFVWTNGQMTSLSLPGGTISFAMGINTQGAVVGSSYMSNNIPRAFEYVGGTVYDLLLGGVQGSSYANGINSLGQIVGVSTIPVGPTHAFLRDTASDTTYDLGTLGGASSEAYAINSLSQVVGSAYTAQNQMHAFLWTPTGGMIDLGSLAGANGVSTASNVNDLTQVVGYSSSSTYVHAFYWSQATGMTDLGTFGGNASFAYGINNQSQVVGYADTGISGQAHAFLWTAASGLHDLNAFLPANSGWQLQEARAINNVGQIVGWGVHNGLERSFLLSPLGVQSVTVSPSSLAGGNPATATVTLNMVTPTDITVSLASTNHAVSAPTSVLIKAGTSSNSVALTTIPVASVTTGTIVATYNGIAHSASITIRPPVIKTLAFNPSSVKGGGTVLAGITLDGPVAVSTVVKLTSNNTTVAAPTVTSITLAPKAKIATFSVQTHPVKISTMVTISAAMNGTTKSAMLTVTPTLILTP